MVIDSQRTFIDSGALVISSQRTSVDNCDDSISEAFNPVYGADNRIVERRKRVAVLCVSISKTDGCVAGKFAAFPPPAGPVCKPKLRIAKVGLAIAARYNPVAMPLLDSRTCRGIGAGTTDVVGDQFMEVGGHWVVLLMTRGTEPNSERFVE